MINIASVVTHNYVERALTMFNSMLSFRDDCHLDLLVINGLRQDCNINLKNVKLHHIDDFYDHPTFGLQYRSIVARHSQPIKRPTLIDRHDYLRWSLKSVFVNILLEDYDRVYFCDHDLHFYEDFSFLDDDAEGKSICLSPHWRTIKHTADVEWEYNFRHGLYNGGFFIVNKSGKEILDWWSEMCSFKCTADELDSTYVDQKYLDVVPLYFDDVHIIKHKGCNVAAWNRVHLERRVEEGRVTVDGHPIIFIHFSSVTEDHINLRKDFLLMEHHREYKEALLETRLNLLRNNGKHFTAGNIESTDLI